MTETEALYRDTRRVMRRQARASALARITPYVMPGGPRRHAPDVPDLPLRKYLVGGGGPPLSLSLDGGLKVPAALQPAQQRPPRRAPERHSGCCHCAQAEQQAARQRVWSQARRSKSTVDPVFDAHGDFFAASAVDFLATWYLATFGYYTLGSATWERVGWLAGDMAATGINHMVLSGFYDATCSVTTTAGDYPLVEDDKNAYERDYSVVLASVAYPNFFLPFTNGFSLGGTDPVGDLETQIGAWSKWRGIGEIIVHGHGSHFDSEDDTLNLQAILLMAAEEGLPVQLHWDICQVDSKDSSPSDNYGQLCDVLSASPDTTVILAHCGVGEYNSATTATFDVDNWKGYIGDLIAAYPNLYFDLGGMQVGTSTDALSVAQLMDADLKAPTKVGEFLLETMGAYPERFMLGTDVETRTATEWTESTSPDGDHHFGIDQYAASVSAYEAFLQYGLDQGYLEDPDVTMIRRTNGEDLFGV